MSADTYGKGVKKADNDLVARRVDKVIELISLCKPSSDIVSYCTAEWGVKDRQAEKYLEKARAKIRERFDQMEPQGLGCKCPGETRESGCNVNRIKATQQCHRCSRPQRKAASDHRQRQLNQDYRLLHIATPGTHKAAAKIIERG